MDIQSLINLIPKPDGNSATLDSKPFVLRQFRFYHPSEHFLEGRQFDAELLIVHQNLEVPCLNEGVNKMVPDTLNFDITIPIYEGVESIYRRIKWPVQVTLK